jgi:formamidopyrimidine-DNA glycosylase
VLELPEVEVLRKDLEKEIVGKRVKDVTVETPALVRSFHRNRPDFAKALTGRKVEGVRRRGRVLFVDLDGDVTWVIDAGEAGSLRTGGVPDEPGTTTHASVNFASGGALHLSEAGVEPTMSSGVVARDRAFEEAGISPDALDPLDDNPTWMEFGRFLAAADRPLKLLLIDSEYILGIGPVYSDEILWEAGLRHDRSSASLSTQEVRRLYRATQEVITTGMKASGSSLDETDTDPIDDDEVALHLRVHGRDGLPCSRCRRPIKRTRLRKGLYTYHCEQCMI